MIHNRSLEKLKELCGIKCTNNDILLCQSFIKKNKRFPISKNPSVAVVLLLIYFFHGSPQSTDFLWFLFLQHPTVEL